MTDKPSFFRTWAFAPVFMLFFYAALALAWAVAEPQALRDFFDDGGYSPFELFTAPFYLAIAPLVWWKCPFSGSRARKAILGAAVTCVALMAVAKQLDLHLLAMQNLFPEVVNAKGSVYGLVKPNGSPLTGTPFKMRFLTNPGAPFAAKVFVTAYFGLFFGVFAATLAYYMLPVWVKPSFLGCVLKLEAPAWSVGCMGASGVAVQICDRMPAWLRHSGVVEKGAEGTENLAALFTVFEEGGELALALFGIIAILQAHAALKARGARAE